MQEYYIKRKWKPAALVLAVLHGSGTRPARLPPPSGSGEPPPERYPGGVPGCPGWVSLNPSNKFFSKKGFAGIDKIEKV